MKTLRFALAALVALPLVAAAPPPPEALAAQARGLAGNLMLSLQGELFAAMKEGGPVRALDVCRVKAPEIARATATGTPWRIARTSLRVRNASNAPDAWETAKLEEFGKRLAAGGSALKPAVAAKVKELYPEDQAVGFAAGQLRGAFTLSRPL